MPDLRQLRAFVAVADELNFTRAAERLHLGQQAVSKAVDQLERELGVALLERTTREVSLTPAGVALLDGGREVLRAADLAFERARAVGRGLSGTIQVGATPAVGPRVLEEVVRVLREAADVAVSLHQVRPGGIGALLRDRELDLVLARTAPSEPRVDSAPLRPSRATLWVPAGHRLATAPGVRLADLDGERLLTHNPAGTPYTDLLLDRIAASGAAVEPVESRVTGAGSLGELVDLGAVALVPEGWPTGEGVVALPLEEGVFLPLIVLWATGLPSPAVARVRAAMSSAA